MIERLRRNGLLLAPMLLVAFTLSACAADEPAEDAAPEETDAEEAPEPASQADVYFVNIEEGGTYTSPVEIVFGVDGFEIVPVEDPPVVRDGEGHFHLAVDVACADAGDVIVAGNPSYIHFGDGSDRISMQFEAGEHELCLQVADGEHRVLGPEFSSLTEHITITVAESDS